MSNLHLNKLRARLTQAEEELREARKEYIEGVTGSLRRNQAQSAVQFAKSQLQQAEVTEYRAVMAKH